MTRSPDLVPRVLLPGRRWVYHRLVPGAVQGLAAALVEPLRRQQS